MKRGALLALACGLYIVFWVGTAPAWILSHAVALATNGRARLEGTKGTLWHGFASAIVVHDRLAKPERYEQLRWEFLWGLLFQGELAAHVQIEDVRVRGRGNVVVRRDTVRVIDAALEMPVSALIPHFPVLAAVKLSGALVFTAKEFAYGEKGASGEIIANWKNASSGIVAVDTLGDYLARITGTTQGIEFQISSEGAVLRVEGRGGWTSKEGAWYEGIAQAGSASRAELAQLLGTLGPDLGNGVHRVRLNRESTRAN